MPKCDLQIVLDRPDRTFSVGEKITGRVDVLVREDCVCRCLAVTCKWKTEGRGEEDSGGIEEPTLFSGHWKLGQLLSYPFQLCAPKGPLSFNGTLFRLFWFVSAQADLALAKDVVAEERITLVAGNPPPGDAFMQDSHPKAMYWEASPARSYPPGWSTIIATVSGAGFGFFVLLKGIREAVSEDFWKGVPPVAWWAIGQAAMGLAVLIVCAREIFAWFGQYVAASSLGSVVHALPESARRGETVECSVSIPQNAGSRLTAATARLTATEVAHEGDPVSYDAHILYDRRLVMEVTRGHPFVASRVILKVPPDAVTNPDHGLAQGALVRQHPIGTERLPRLAPRFPAYCPAVS